METEYLVWLIDILLVGFAFMLKRELNQKDEAIQELRQEQMYFRQNYLHKDDFKDFKAELWKKFDEVRQDIRAVTSVRHEKD